MIWISLFERNEEGEFILETWQRKVGRWLVRERIYLKGKWTPFARISLWKRGKNKVK